MPPRLIMPASSYRAAAPPKMPASRYKSFVIHSPQDRTVKTVCEEAGCEYWRDGWDSPVDERTGQGRTWAAIIRFQSKRTFRELQTADGVTIFRFEPGQRCFRNHQTRPETFLVRGGDFRGNPRGERRVHKNAADWVEDGAIHMDRLVTAIRRG
jgi:hypothetical protein